MALLWHCTCLTWETISSSNERMVPVYVVHEFQGYLSVEMPKNDYQKPWENGRGRSQSRQNVEDVFFNASIDT
jgi:hypothetical protein